MKAMVVVSNVLMYVGFGIFLFIQFLGRNGLLSDADGALSTTAIMAAMGLSMGITAATIRFSVVVSQKKKSDEP